MASSQTFLQSVLPHILDQHSLECKNSAYQNCDDYRQGRPSPDTSGPLLTPFGRCTIAPTVVRSLLLDGERIQKVSVRRHSSSSQLCNQGWTAGDTTDAED
jgi:hypothetical protein